ncbi:MAG TPA: hypothetical protein VGB00_14780 [Pyrinomonadaceae bacterium]|jgi:hypothetical protein
MKSRRPTTVFFACLLFFFSCGKISAQNFDISSGGQPTISGALNGSVTGSASVQSNLSVTINFGEISPANRNSVVKVVVPVAIRSTAPYQVAVSLSGMTGANPQSVQPSDIGFGITNIRSMGNNAQDCANSSHIIYSPFGNDPVNTDTISAGGRVAYQSTLANVSGSTLILSGPRLSKSSNSVRQTNDGYIFDAIFVVTPQFFAGGAASGTLTFTISSGPSVQC